MSISRQIISRALRIRIFESKLLSSFQSGFFSGTTHTCIGQELTPVITLNNALENDFIFSNHRSHGHYLAHTGDYRGLLRELLGAKDGINQGYAGSQHIFTQNFIANGILGGLFPCCLGVAEVFKYQSNGALSNVCFQFSGDGALSEGIIYESLNYASLRKLPIIYIVEKNDIAQSTPLEESVAGDLSARFRAFGIDCLSFNHTDKLESILNLVSSRIRGVRRGAGPVALIFEAPRLGPHSRGDDTRNSLEIEDINAYDWLVSSCADHSPTLFLELSKKLEIELDDLFRRCVEDIEVNPPEKSRNKFKPISTVCANDETTYFPQIDESLKFKDRIYLEIDRLLGKSKRVIFYGEDLSYPYGGAFKVSQDLQMKYPHQVWSTPISEAALVGAAIGFALKGYTPIVEIMFGDFLYLCSDQIINHASKLTSISKDGLDTPIIIRAPVGGYRGYGSTHSQTNEGLFLGFDNITVWSVTWLTDLELVYERIIAQGRVNILLEAKTALNQCYRDARINSYFSVRRLTDDCLTCVIACDSLPVDCYIWCHGQMADIALESTNILLRTKEINCNLIVVTNLSAMPSFTEIDIQKTHVILTESRYQDAWVQGLAHQIQASCQPKVVDIVSAMGSTIPSSLLLEKDYLPSTSDVIARVTDLCQ